MPYGCLMAEVEPGVRRVLEEWVRERIDPADIVDEDGDLCDHVTVYYGLADDAGDSVEEECRKRGAFPLVLGSVSLFCDSPEYDVLKVDVFDPTGELGRLHTALFQTHGAVITRLIYLPHVTLAYVRKGSCVRYVGDATLAGKSWMVTGAILSSADRSSKRTIPIGSERVAELIAESSWPRKQDLVESTESVRDDLVNAISSGNMRGFKKALERVRFGSPNMYDTKRQVTSALAQLISRQKVKGEEVLRELIAKGMTPDEMLYFAVNWHARFGESQKLVERLLEMGARAKGPIAITAIIKGFTVDVVRGLVEAGAATERTRDIVTAFAALVRGDLMLLPPEEKARWVEELRSMGFGFYPIDVSECLRSTRDPDGVLLKALLENVDDIDGIDDERGTTVLIELARWTAEQHNHTKFRPMFEVMKDLVRNGADPMMRDRSGKTASDILTEGHFEKTARELYSIGAQLRFDGSQHGDIPLVESMSQEEVSDSLMAAVVHGDHERVAKLLQAGADPNVFDEVGTSALSASLCTQATVTGDLRVVEALLAGGADPRMVDKDGTPPILVAMSGIQFMSVETMAKVVRALIDKGADIDQRDAYGLGVLHVVILECDKDDVPNVIFMVPVIIHRLIELGADPNAKDDDGWTPLHQAASLSSSSFSAHCDVMEALLMGGADPLPVNNDGMTPMDFLKDKEGDHGHGIDVIRKYATKVMDRSSASGDIL